MNDNKLSHKNPALISDIIDKLQKQFGNLYVVRENKHTLLGMSIDIKDNIIKVDMVEHLEECISMFGGYLSTSVSYPATKKFFEIR